MNFIRVLMITATLISIYPASASDQAPEKLRTQIEDLASEHGFSARALNKLGDDQGKSVEGDVHRQLAVLLSNFNYVTLNNDVGDIDTVIITSRIVPGKPKPRDFSVKTSRRGAHHAVKTTLTGPGGKTQSIMLLVDTGASTIVLPNTMRKSLGFAEKDLKNSWSQTANGRVQTKTGTLRSARVGHALVKGVAVNFFDDDPLGGNSLLGMSFLSQFSVTIDDRAERIILKGRK